MPCHYATESASGVSCRPAYSLVTTDVIEAACACLIAMLEDSSAMNESETVGERLVLEEFGRCLTRVIDSANNLTGCSSYCCSCCHSLSNTSSTSSSSNRCSCSSNSRNSCMTVEEFEQCLTCATDSTNNLPVCCSCWLWRSGSSSISISNSSSSSIGGDSSSVTTEKFECCTVSCMILHFLPARPVLLAWEYSNISR